MSIDAPPPRLVVAQMLESDGPGGAELVELRLSAALRGRGHTVVPVGPARGCGWLAGCFRAQGFVPEVFTLRRPIDWRCVQGLVALLRRRGVQVVHSHEFTMAVYGAAAAWRLGIPHVITMHGAQTLTTKLRRRTALRWAFRSSAATVAVSDDTKRHLDSSLGLRPDMVTVIRNGVPRVPGDRQQGRRTLGVTDDTLLVLAVGSLVPRKGHEVLIEALANVEMEGNGGRAPWRLAIAGGGIERDGLASLATARGVGDRVQLLGHREDVPDLLAAADIFVMPSLWEGLPLALLEAMLGGHAVVASRTAGIPEAVTDGVDGVLVPPGDVAALGTAIRQLLADPARRAALGAAARARAERCFSIDAMTDAYEHVYSRVVDVAGRGTAPRTREA